MTGTDWRAWLRDTAALTAAVALALLVLWQVGRDVVAASYAAGYNAEHPHDVLRELAAVTHTARTRDGIMWIVTAPTCAKEEP
jgi:hypothetical protein